MNGNARRMELAATERDSFDELLREAVSLSDPMAGIEDVSLSSGATLAAGRLTIRRRIGHGGMGVVYEAFDEQRNALVALKTLSHLHPAGIYRLKNEFRSLADVRHANVVNLHELFACDGAWFFTMDLLAGSHFDAWSRDTAHHTDTASLRAAIVQLLDALDAIHAAGKLHRDLKPGNVLVTADGLVVVLDFGLAVDPVLGGVGQTLPEHELSGTPGYMAPEQALGEPATSASDLYALGVILFEAVTGRLPFEGRPHEVLLAKQRTAAPSMLTFVPSAPADLAALCADLLARDPALRPTSAQARARLGLGAQPRISQSQPRQALQLVGRDAELLQLQAAFEASATGTKPVVLMLAGESGIGKSALLDTFVDQQHARGGAVLVGGRCYERESVPFKGFDSLIDSLSRHLRRLPNEQAVALLPRDAYALSRLFPALGRLEPFASAPGRDVSDSHELRRRAFSALGELLGRMSDRQPVVLYVDDLQWSDADSTLLWLHIFRQRDAPRVLFIASHRSEEMVGHPFLEPFYAELKHDQRVDLRQLRLGPLSLEATGTLLARQLREVPPQLVKESAGRPFLALQLALQATSERLPVGDISLQALVVARWNRLPQSERALIEVLAVAGRPLALPLAASAADVPGRATFEPLRAARLVRSTGVAENVECFHDKIREAIVAVLSAETLRERHAALARELRNSPAADPEQIAGHLFDAGEPRTAADYWVSAAERACRELGFERAARLYSQALAHGSFSAEIRQRIHVARARALAEAGSGSEAAAAFLAAVPGASSSDAIAYRQLAAEQFVYAGDHVRASELFRVVFRALDLRVSESRSGMLASIAYHDARLRLRRYRFSGTTTVEPQIRLQIDALRYAANALLRTDPAKGFELGMRETLLALTRGTARDASMALARQAYMDANLGKSTAHFDKMIARAEKLLPADDVEAHCYLVFCRGAARALAVGHRDVKRANSDLQLVIDMGREHAAPGVSYQRMLGECMLALTRATSGELAAVSSDMPAKLDEAWSRKDYTLLPFWMWVYGYCGPATEDLDGLEHAQRKVVALWGHSTCLLQDLNLSDSLFHSALYRGNWRGAHEICEALHARVSRSPLRGAMIVSAAERNRGLAAATHAKHLPQSSERQALTGLVETIAAKNNDPLLRAAHACLHLNAAAAVSALRTYRADYWAIEKYAVQRRLGVLLGGSEGAALVTESDAFFQTGGVKNPARFAACLMPGIAIGEED